MLKTDETVVALVDHPVMDAPVYAITPNGSYTFCVERIEHASQGPILRLHEVARRSEPTSEVKALQRQLEAARQENLVLRAEIRFHKAAGEAFDSIVADRDWWRSQAERKDAALRAEREKN